MVASGTSSPLTSLFLFLQFLPVLCNVDISHCPLFQKPSVYRNGDLVLDGFFTLYSLRAPQNLKQLSFLSKPNKLSPNKWHWNNYKHVLVFLFAIEEINKNTNLLPNLTVGFNIYNVLGSDQWTYENILFWLSGGNQMVVNYNCQEEKKSFAIIAGTRLEFFADIGPLLELYKVPQVTYGPYDSLLNDKNQFPSLYQMSAEDKPLVHGLLQLLQDFNWTWVGVCVSQDIQSEQFLWDLQDGMLKKGICAIPAIRLYPPWIRETEATLNVNTFLPLKLVNVSIVYGDADIFIAMHTYAVLYVISAKVWILVTKSYIDFNKMNKVLDLFYGSLCFTQQKKELPGFEHFLKTMNPSKYPEDFYLLKFWQDVFDCSDFVSQCGKLKGCAPNSSLEFMSGNADIMTYNAVYAVARAFHEMILKKAGTEMTRDVNPPMFLSWQLHSFLRNVHFTNVIGDHISLNGELNSQREYDIINILSFTAVRGLLAKVGVLISSDPRNQTLVIHEDIIEWPVELEKPPQSVCSPSCGGGYKQVILGTLVCCFKCVLCKNGEISNTKDPQQCIQCSKQEYPNQERNYCLSKSVTFFAFEDSFGLALACTALCLSILTLLVSWVFVKHQHTPIVKANNRVLSYILLASILLCFLCSLLYIGRPNTVTCILQQVTFGIVFTVAVSSVLAKTITVILAFRATKPGRTVRWLLVSGASNSVIPICTLIQVVICGVWLGTSPPFIDIDSHSDPTQLILMCNKGSITAFYCVLGYLGSLALLSFCLSYQVRNLPDTFNEAKFLTFSMLVFCSIWVTFLPVYHSARGKVMVALEVFSILASSAGLLVCIFAPKCFIILVRPEKNTLKILRNKMGSRRNTHS